MSKVNSSEKKPIYWKNQKPPNSDEVFTDPFFPLSVNSLIELDSSSTIFDDESYNEYIDKMEIDGIDFYHPKDILGDEKKKLEQEKEKSEKRAKESKEEAKKKLDSINEETERISLSRKKIEEYKIFQEIKKQFKLAKENEEKLEKEIVKNKEGIKKIFQENQKKIKEKKDKKIEKFKKEENKKFNVSIYNLDYLRKKEKQNNIIDLEQRENDACFSYECDICNIL